MPIHKVEVKEITPALAAKWLQEYAKNRPISGAFVERYAEDMRQDRWELNGETIKFSPQGHLLDGRHRLTACVESGISFVSYVAFGVENYSEIDIGKKRTLADAITIFGNSKISGHCAFAVNAAVAMLLSYAQESRAKAPIPSTHSGNIMTHRERLTFVLHNKELNSVLPEFQQYLVMAKPLRPSVALVLLWLAKVADLKMKEIHRFLMGVKEGTDLRSGDPALAYRNLLLGAAFRHRTLTAREATRAAIGALIHHLRGESMKVAKIPDYPVLPGAEPELVRKYLGLKD